LLYASERLTAKLNIVKYENENLRKAVLYEKKET
jgi:hypothetical protein